ncbi:hypothetical protein Xcel_0156 [Xylanimonas cellulosilytica DSM 15894]|uniref:Uncharacterized protein n=1 Tax=Xylanimonas cellulosilytica (strain DSM 15894 / JCM 12276 / CECT 5975 / KCTC 9989 / LMG 20990 / NBRC 107835 / XIL07) TaxID=446471 RepID=D1BU31_XYLCX|nr:hypothetical protein [Xylanimonas cellulosilytica]ACZ29195.1 hypothetical protein Xcel_0156 [Xylanimonas cellulosilytica DSM 15894]
MPDTENLHRSIANPRRTTLSGRTHAEVVAQQPGSRAEDDAER